MSLAVIGVLLLVVLTLSTTSLEITAGTSSQQRGSTQYDSRTFRQQHPIKQLVTSAKDEFESLRANQSPTLHAAVIEYHRRYKLPPPPHFDRWYEFAVERGTQLIDEFDSIFDSLVLFWGVNPAVIQERLRQMLHDEKLGLVTGQVRGGNVKILGEGQDRYQGRAIEEMISKFSQWLPDMDLAFNLHDEARVLVAHEDTVRLRAEASASISAVRPVTTVYSLGESQDSQYPADLVPKVYFNRLDHQQTFTHSCMSCPPHSPSRNLERIEDAQVGYTYDGITFVDNVTLYSDMCLRPSARPLVGMFNHPNIYSISHDLVPLFTPSKPSTFHDILYPSYYYYKDRTTYDQDYAVPWEKKMPHLYWRGATSGGYSEEGIWKNLLRQSILIKLSAEGTTRILYRGIKNLQQKWWIGKEVDRLIIKDRYDVKFTEIKQCSQKDCAEMHQQFGTNPHAPQEEAWKNRYLLDMDGNAFSGRFYALLRSFSLPFKLAFYREWHMERIFPWAHYVPVSSTTDEYAEILRYFEEETEGQDMAKELASHGRDWAQKVVRPSDMEVYMFRLLLEYGRVLDDNRLNLGYTS